MTIFPFLSGFSPDITFRDTHWRATIESGNFQMDVYAGRDRYSTPCFCLPDNGKYSYTGVEVHLSYSDKPVDLAVFFPEGHFPPGSIQRYVPVAIAAKIAAAVTKKVPV